MPSLITGLLLTVGILSRLFGSGFGISGISLTSCSSGTVAFLSSNDVQIIQIDATTATAQPLTRIGHSFKISGDITVKFASVAMPNGCLILLCTNAAACAYYRFSGQIIEQLTNPAFNNSNFDGTKSLVMNFGQVSGRSDERLSLYAAFYNNTPNGQPPEINKFTLKYDASAKSLSAQAAQLGYDSVMTDEKISIGETMENVYSFETGGFAYFLRNKLRAYKSDERSDSRTEWVTHLTRICVQDNTNELKSRVELKLTCAKEFDKSAPWPSDAPPSLTKPTLPSNSQRFLENQALFAESAYFSESIRSLYVVFHPRDDEPPSKRARRLCAFALSDIESKIKETADKCSSARGIRKVFNGAVMRKRNDALGPDGFSCHRLTVSELDSVGSCSPDQLITWLLDDMTLQLNGRPALYWETNAEILDMVLDERDFSFLLVRDKNGGAVLSKVLLSSGNQIKKLDDAATWKQTLAGSSTPFPLMSQRLLRVGDKLAYVSNDNEVVVLPIGCQMHSSCKAVLAAVSQGEANCVWCLFDQGKSQAARTPGECVAPAATQFPSDCPPTIDKVIVHAGGGIFTIMGDGFPNSRSFAASICGVPCRITSPHGPSSFECTLENGTQVDQRSAACQTIALDVSVGKLERVRIAKAFNWTPSDGPVTYQPPAKENASVIVSIIAVVLVAIVFLAIAAVCCYRKHMRKRSPGRTRLPSHIDPGFYPERSQSHLYEGRQSGGEFGMVSVSNGLNPYAGLPEFVPDEVKIPLGKLSWGKEIGSGHFGRVLKGTYKPDPEAVPQDVAIKVLQNTISNVRQFLGEGLLMKDFKHPHVLGLVGISFADGWIPLIVTPFMANGDLEHYLKDDANAPTIRQVLTFAVQIAQGMQMMNVPFVSIKHLHKLKFVHRDLACRNCMLDEMLRVKIADFGLCRDVYETQQYTSQQAGGFLPCRWMPLESIERGVYDEKTDVWSYGVLLWELMTRCQMPYAGMSSPDVIQYLKAGNRLPQPSLCPDPIYALMRACWDTAPAYRPSFTELCHQLPTVMEDLDRRSGDSAYDLDAPYANIYSAAPPPPDGYERPDSELVNAAIVPSHSRTSDFSGRGSTAPLIRWSTAGTARRSSSEASSPETIIAETVTTV